MAGNTTSALENIALVKGVYACQDDLIRLKNLAKLLTRNSPQKRQRAQMGSHKSRSKGRGLDFAELRSYQAGDEIRHIDWRVTAKTSKPYTKLFEDEKERPVIVCLDQRQSLFFGSVNCFKSKLAAHIAATLIWAGLAKGDRVGGLVFNDTSHQDTRPRRNHKSALEFIHSAVAYNTQLTPETLIENSASTSLTKACEELQRVCKPGSTVYFISDFEGFDDNCAKQLRQIARHTRIEAINLNDPMESTLPTGGNLAFNNGRQHLRLDVDAKLVTTFQQQRLNAEQYRQATFKRLGIGYSQFSTANDFFTSLRQLVN